jgi:hypothetical protein
MMVYCLFLFHCLIVVVLDFFVVPIYGTVVDQISDLHIEAIDHGGYI